MYLKQKKCFFVKTLYLKHVFDLFCTHVLSVALKGGVPRTIIGDFCGPIAKSLRPVANFC